MEISKKFQKSVLKRENVRMFNRSLDLYYSPKTLTISLSDVDEKVKKGSDTLIKVKKSLSVECVFYIYTSLEGVDTTNPVHTHRLSLSNIPDINLYKLSDYVMSKLKEEFEDSTIIKK